MSGERFKVTRYYRQARRGGGEMVHDGWDLTDTLTGARQHFTLKNEAKDRIARVVMVEEEIRTRLSEVASWDADLEFRNRTPNVEMYLFGKDGAKLTFRWAGAPVLVERAYAPARVVEWLQMMGLGDLQRREG